MTPPDELSGAVDTAGTIVPGAPVTEIGAGGDGEVSAEHAPLTALPVDVEVGGRLGAEVRRYVETVLGWQPVDAATAPVVPPALRLVDGDVPPSARRAGAPAGDIAGGGDIVGVGGDIPTVLLLRAEMGAQAAADLGALVRPEASLAWPGERSRLADVAMTLLRRPRRSPVGVEVARIGGAAGGVGTSTIALALAGLAAWRRHRVLVVVGPGAPVADPARVPADALAAPGLLHRARPLTGVAGAALVQTPEHLGGPALGVAGIDLMVVDAGVHRDVDVLVCRPDRAGLHAVAETTAGIVVVNGTGAATHRDLAASAGGRRLIAQPWSARVARAGLRARVPTGLPGSWLQRLLPAVPQPAMPAPAERR